MTWTLLALFHVVVFSYFVLLNGYYLVTSLFAFRTLRRYGQRLTSFDMADLVASSGAPAVSIIVPAYNEGASCRETVQSLLQLNYPEHEVILTDDGSTDDTLEVLREAYRLVPAPRAPVSDLDTAPIKTVYRSLTHPNFWVVAKENGGSSDAINAGLNFCRTPLFCITDADSLLERNALIHLVRPFLEDRETIAAGGVIRVANGCKVKNSRVEEVALPDEWTVRFQILEYLRSFLSGRVGWSDLGIMLLISGAFGLFRRSVVIEAGGLDASNIGEDFELTVRLHRHCREQGRSYRVVFVPKPVAWTEAPESLRVLGRQRDRWQRGLVDTMRKHARMLFNPRYGRIGMVAYPYFFFLEMLGPVVESAGYAVFIFLLVTGYVSSAFALLFLLLAFVLGVILSVLSVGLEELSFRRYERSSDLIRLLGLAVLEGFGYRQLLVFYRLRGFLSYLRGYSGWGDMERRGFKTQEPRATRRSGSTAVFQNS
jgi:cellulose synthase/poly-beta-1,6-N-acetylglucosamine synthase-like glycosyltransferase